MTPKHSITLTSAPVAAALTERDPQARELVVGNAPQFTVRGAALTPEYLMGFRVLYAVRHLMDGEK